MQRALSRTWLKKDQALEDFFYGQHCSLIPVNKELWSWKIQSHQWHRLWLATLPPKLVTQCLYVSQYTCWCNLSVQSWVNTVALPFIALDWFWPRIMASPNGPNENAYYTSTGYALSVSVRKLPEAPSSVSPRHFSQWKKWSCPVVSFRFVLFSGHSHCTVTHLTCAWPHYCICCPYAFHIMLSTVRPQSWVANKGQAEQTTVSFFLSSVFCVSVSSQVLLISCNSAMHTPIIRLENMPHILPVQALRRILEVCGDRECSSIVHLQQRKRGTPAQDKE